MNTELLTTQTKAVSFSLVHSGERRYDFAALGLFYSFLGFLWWIIFIYLTCICWILKN